MTIREALIANPIQEGESTTEYYDRIHAIMHKAGFPAARRSIKHKYNMIRASLPDQPPPTPKPQTVEKEKKTWDERAESAEFHYEGFRELTTLEDALAFCNADLEIWDVDRWVFNSWDVTMKGADGDPIKRTNYQVKIWFRRKIDVMEIDEWTDVLKDRARPFFVKRANGSGIGVFKIADFHIGAHIGSLLKTPEFNHNTLIHYFDTIAEYINSRKYDKVYLSLLGDFIESFTGMNHLDSWKGIQRDGYGIKVVKFAHNMLRDHLYTKVNNLEWVGFVSGNHDRVADKKDGDQEGGAAEALHWAFTMEVDVDSEWHPVLISKVIDGICYIDTHGHLGLTKSDIAQIVFKYGNPDIYNIFCKGHKHTREQKRRWVKTQLQISNQEVVSYDEAQFRAITVPPLFTGNFYSQSNDWNGLAGFVEFYNNGRGHPIFIDYTL